MSEAPRTPDQQAFEENANRIRGHFSYFGRNANFQIDRMAPGEAWTRLPYQPVFVGYVDTGVLHGGIVTTLLDETCGIAVQLALEGLTPIATLDLRIDYQRPSTPGKELCAHAHCYSVTRSIAFVRATAYHEGEDAPVATATGCFMINANRSDKSTADVSAYKETVLLDAPEDETGTFANSPFSRCLGIRPVAPNTVIMPFSKRIIGNIYLPAIHGGLIGAFLETAAIYRMRQDMDVANLPRPIGLTINYLRSGRAVDSYASVSIVKHGRRIVAFEAKAWQDDPARPIASAYGHFMVRQSPQPEND